ncbi:hypothetical protein N7522_008095 [Penicillium canescens]|uniref:Uncharacterized protein n=1 Tax=Penicillium canescens TaxID=5083 RepID=A0AAD6IF23_PENCN|nr:uncharacterized protein N7446_002939 [Penicillium canescens]KAJ5996435.1 hypothetical protein N7522_008095 [Penicillium canescens]KAJ6044745.1 hypothetical protein N7460_006100 [Penicillium canescens]KAJ6056214.1 hypothetical protein N7444_005312 [Penicillium canescens]KAJ6075162.1 hypothetical protein N7446_002939 [Penicillium canescens]
MATWEVTGFQIQTATPELNSSTLDADGSMQLPVYVFIKANVKGTNDRYYLTEEELNSIELIDFGHTNHRLSDGWSYSDKEEVSAPSTSVTPPSRVSGNDNIGDDYQLKCYWVSTTKTEDKNIAACITQPDGKTVTTETSAEGPYVNLAGSTTTIFEVVPEVTICRPQVLF